ncbi:MAG: hypothetical protein E6902_14625 [Paeniclostridium sordellii]|nr:hypothetical protein [Paeniclostridium sordellii]
MNLQDRINSLLVENLGSISRETKEYVSNIEKLKSDAKKRFDSFYNRKNLIDKLVISNLAITPIILMILIYWTLIKK